MFLRVLVRRGSSAADVVKSCYNFTCWCQPDILFIFYVGGLIRLHSDRLDGRQPAR
jgi:hypothetical protein